MAGAEDGAVIELSLFLGRCGLELGTVMVSPVVREGVSLEELLEMEGDDEGMKKVGVKTDEDRRQLENAIREHKASRLMELMEKEKKLEVERDAQQLKMAQLEKELARTRMLINDLKPG
jgi:hypothetical protein